MYFLALFVYPALLGVLSLGLGLLAGRIAGVHIPGALLAPLGFAGIVCLTQLGTQLSATAKLTAPLLVILTVAGLALGRGRLRALASPAALPAMLVAVAAFVAYAAPVMLSGQVGWTSYGVDTTPPIHWLGADQLANHGRSFVDVGRSSSAHITAGYFNVSYPSGGNTALGVTQQLTGVSVAWLFQPYLAVSGAMLALVLLWLVQQVLASPWLAAVTAFVAAQPALLYAFFLQGQMKEVLAALLVPLVAATTVLYARTLSSGPRAAIPLAIAGAAGMGATGVGFAAWLGPGALLALIAVAWTFWTTDRKQVLLHAGVFVLGIVVRVGVQHGQPAHAALLLDRPDQLAEVHVGHTREGDADRTGRAAGQRPGDRVRGVGELVDRVADALLGRLADRPGLVDDVGDRRLRDAGQPGDVVDRGHWSSSSLVAPLLRNRLRLAIRQYHPSSTR